MGILFWCIVYNLCVCVCVCGGGAGADLSPTPVALRNNGMCAIHYHYVSRVSIDENSGLMRCCLQLIEGAGYSEMSAHTYQAIPCNNPESWTFVFREVATSCTTLQYVGYFAKYEKEKQV